MGSYEAEKKTVLKAWSAANSLHPMSPGHILQHNPLWFNLKLLEFMSVPDPSVWALNGIKYLDQICTGGWLRTFDKLKQMYGLPNSYLFRFLQLRPAFNSQFESSQVTFYTSTLEDLLRDRSTVKHLSNIYKSLLHNLHAEMEPLKAKWMGDFPSLDAEDWEEMWVLFLPPGLH